MIRRPPRSTLFPYTTLLPILIVKNEERHLAACLQSVADLVGEMIADTLDRKSTRLNSSHANISYAVFCLKKKRTVSVSSRLGSRPFRGRARSAEECCR